MDSWLVSLTQTTSWATAIIFMIQSFGERLLSFFYSRSSTFITRQLKDSGLRFHHKLRMVSNYIIRIIMFFIMDTPISALFTVTGNSTDVTAIRVCLTYMLQVSVSFLHASWIHIVSDVSSTILRPFASLTTQIRCP
jgi:hypothetical protein